MLTIGEGNRADTVRISDTGPVVKYVGSEDQVITVREMIGGMNGWIGGRQKMLAAMRNTAKLAVPGEVFATHLVNLWYAQGQHHATFRVSYFPVEDDKPDSEPASVGDETVEKIVERLTLKFPEFSDSDISGILRMGIREGIKLAIISSELS